MYENLMAIKSVMSETASIYLHLDWHIGHYYVKVLMDEVFGEINFRNEIIWHYDIGTAPKTDFKRKHDTIFRYSKNHENIVFNSLTIDAKNTERYDNEDENGRKYMVRGDTGKIVYSDEGQKEDDVWTYYKTDELRTLNSMAKERTEIDYNTQKPEALLIKIIITSSNEGMIVADLFGGSGVSAKVSNDLKRNFIHCDVGLNSIQTTRDRLKAQGAEFEILEIKDGVNLFRNPVQTMDKLKKMILGLKNEDALDKFWEGSINDSKLGTVPVYIPNLLDHTTKVLDIPLMNRVINEAIPDLPDGVKKVIVYYVDIDDKKEIEDFIKDQSILVEIELRDLKEILADVVVDDIVEYELKEVDGIYNIELTKFISDRLKQKIDEYNQKGMIQPLTEPEVETDSEEDDESEPVKKKKKFSPIDISEYGLELIELVSLDCTNKDGDVWQSDIEIKIDKLGYVIADGKKTKTFWDAKISFDKKPLRMKVRNIAGDEVILSIN